MSVYGRIILPAGITREEEYYAEEETLWCPWYPHYLFWGNEVDTMAISKHSDTLMMWSHVLMMNGLAKTHIFQLPQASGKPGLVHHDGHGPSPRLTSPGVAGCQAIQGAMRARMSAFKSTVGFYLP